jgi:hypothetical protein
MAEAGLVVLIPGHPYRQSEREQRHHLYHPLKLVEFPLPQLGLPLLW